MKITNIRLGRATNSSSSHSIVVTKDPSRVKSVSSSSGSFAYGWDHFVLKEEKEKLEYFLVPLINDLLSAVGREQTIELVRQWFDYDIEHAFVPRGYGDKPDQLVFQGYIDHQSMFRYGFDNIDNRLDQVAELINTLAKNPNIVVFGGNDNVCNEDVSEDLRPHKTDIEIPISLELINAGKEGVGKVGSVAMRSDQKSVTIFSRTTGNKIRITENNGDYTKSTYPELVDVKITNYCPFGCEFCYQASTKEGSHASFEDIERVAQMLGEMGVFEVAIGGGEPTMHPRFLDILKLFQSKGIAPNFTTFSKHWLKDEKLVKFLSTEWVGSVGVSVHSVKDIDKADAMLSDWRTGKKGVFNRVSLWDRDYTRSTLVVQHVVGSVPMDETIKIVKECAEREIHLLLLGYKDVGFGTAYQKHNTDGFETVLKLALESKHWDMMLSVDTAILQNFPDLPKVFNNIDERLYTAEEGKFSCYIDAVEETMGPSSYCQKEEMVALPMTVEQFAKVYAKW